MTESKTLPSLGSLGWYNQNPNVDLDVTKPDLRILNSTKPGEVTTCSALNVTNTYSQKQCRFWRPSSVDKHHCMYQKWSSMNVCDKVTDSNGESIN